MTTHDEAESTKGLQSYDIVGANALAQAMVELLHTRPSEWWLCAERFDGWPLEQPELNEALIAWSKAQPQGRVYVLAREFTWLERHAARFMNWRRMFAHQVFVKRWPSRLPDELHLPKGIYGERSAIELGVHPAGQLIARHETRAGHIAGQKQALQELWDRGQAALPAQTLGL